MHCLNTNSFKILPILLFFHFFRILLGVYDLWPIISESIVQFLPGFVAASSLGMAAGPFLATPLHHVPNTRVWGLTINSVTMAGWGMALVWILFSVVAFLFFAEPQKSKTNKV